MRVPVAITRNMCFSCGLLGQACVLEEASVLCGVCRSGQWMCFLGCGGWGPQYSKGPRKQPSTRVRVWEHAEWDGLGV